MLNKKDKQYLNDNFINNTDCAKKRSILDDRIDHTEHDLTEIKTSLKMLLKILSAIGVAILGIAVKLIFGV